MFSKHKTWHQSSDADSLCGSNSNTQLRERYPAKAFKPKSRREQNSCANALSLRWLCRNPGFIRNSHDKTFRAGKVISAQEYDTQKYLVDQLEAAVVADEAAIKSAREQLGYPRQPQLMLWPCVFTNRRPARARVPQSLQSGH